MPINISVIFIYKHKNNNLIMGEFVVQVGVLNINNRILGIKDTASRIKLYIYIYIRAIFFCTKY